jgi:NAD(P)H-quinone oxidoreductase subunit 5
MNPLELMLILPPALMVALVLVPNRLANSTVASFRRMVTMIVAAQLVVATLAGVAFLAGWLPNVHWTLLSFDSIPSLAISVYYDGISSLMFALVSFVGWVICQYSIRYLDGEATQGRYYRWTSVAIGSVSLMVLSGNLLMFMGAWIMTSTALHKLLLHYAHRPAAQRAAWTKFSISRLGDVALVGAISLLYYQFGTLEFDKLFQAASDLAVDAQGGTTWALTAAGFLLVLGAVTKSAQFPFHTWLPLTMETPTPVSALMHAGIVNAGGYLIVRTSPLVSLTPWALTLLAVVGGFTALFAAVVMLTQTSVKKKLAYSTIAQMGFMLLQCGLGAFSAAMLHILAHSLYKAHAFLNSGSVIQQAAASRGAAKPIESPSWPNLVFAFSVMVGFLAVSFFAFEINPITKPGGLLLGGVLCLALTHWIGKSAQIGDHLLLTRTVALGAGLCLTYVASFWAVDRVVAASVPHHAFPAMHLMIAGTILACFGLVFLLHVKLSTSPRPEWMNRWYVHASNGFYVENRLRSLKRSFSRGAHIAYKTID